MQKTCAIMQPTYIPWLGYFNLIDQVDIFVLLDDVKLEKQSWQVRNKIKSAGKELMLTIPVLSVNGMDTLIHKAQLNDRTKWRKKHFRTVEQNYSKAPYKKEILEVYHQVLNIDSIYLSDITIDIIKRVCNRIGIETEIVESSKLGVARSTKDQRVVDICKAIKCDRYISPVGAKDYINQYQVGGAFVNSGIDLYYMNYVHPAYTQIGQKFLPFMGIIDLLLNMGFGQSLNIIKSGRKNPKHYKELK